MPRIAYLEKNIRAEKLETIRMVGLLSEEYQSKGLRLSVRQVHYQFVSRGWAPNTGRTYDMVQAAINDGRLCGLLDWEMFEDRERNLMGLHTQVSPASAIERTAQSYRLDLWADQHFRPEVWIEKLSLVGVISDICNELRVDFYAQKGYNSQSEQWRAGQRFADYVRRGQRPIVLHLGDHDPSGVHMTEDNRDRLTMFAGVPVMVQRLALNYSQIEEFRPPENFAKTTDSRIEHYRDHMARCGGDPTVSWELDALDPTVVRDLIADAVGRLRDEEIWSRSLAQEVEDQRTMQDIIATLGEEDE